MNRTYSQMQTAKQDNQLRSKSYNADTLVGNAGHFIPPTRPHPSDNNPSGSKDELNQTVFCGQNTQKPVSTDMTGGTQTSPRKNTQVGGTKTSPPPSPKRSTLSGGTQTTPPRDNVQDQGIQGQPDCNHIRKDPLTNNVTSNVSKGKKNKKKSTYEVPP